MNRPTKKIFVLTWLALVVMHFAILGIAYFLAIGDTALIVLLALVQMVLVLLYFMEVRYSARLVWIFAGAGFFWISFQWALVMSDYLARQWH